MLGRGALALFVTFAAACGLTITGAELTPDAGAPSAEAGAAPDSAAADDDDTPPVIERDSGEPIAELDGSVDAGTVFGEEDAGQVQTSCRKTAWVLSDNDGNTLTGISNALTNAGFKVTQTADYRTFSGDELAAAPPGVVLFLPGYNYYTPSTKLQTNLVNALTQGTGFVTQEWAGYLVALGRLPMLAPYILFKYRSPSYSHKIKLTAIGTHPIWTGLPASFETQASKVALGIGDDRESTTRIATASASSLATQAGVLVKDNGKTRVAETTIAPNYLDDHTLANDATIDHLYVNMALWAAHCL